MPNTKSACDLQAESAVVSPTADIIEFPVATAPVDHALALARRGLRVFPLAPNSKVPPAGFKWPERATTDPHLIRAWWKENSRYNVGVAGARGFLFVDADCKPDKKTGVPGKGLESLDTLFIKGLPADTFQVSTPSGGAHVYLASTDNFTNTAGKIPGFPGIDIRSEGGYVVGPGSTIDGNAYLVDHDAQIAPAPEFLKAVLRQAKIEPTSSRVPLCELDQPQNVSKAISYLKEHAPDAIEGNGGDHTTVTVVMMLSDIGVSEHSALELMLDNWNETKASPPWAPDDLAEKVANGYRYAKNPPGCKAVGADFLGVDLSKEDFGVSPIKRDRDAANENPPAALLPLINARSLAGKALPVRDWLVEGWIPGKQVTLLYGDGGTGKSLILLQLAVAMATERPWLDVEVRPGPCIFVTAEDSLAEVHLRLSDILAATGSDFDDLQNLHIAPLAGHDAILAAPEPRTNLLKPTALFATLEKTIQARRPQLVVLDTLADIFGGEENQRVQARQFVALLRGLCIRNETTIVVAAHPSVAGMASGSGSSGSTGWSNSVRSRLYFHRIKDNDREPDPNVRVIETVKANYGKTGSQIRLRWRAGCFHAETQDSAAAQAANSEAERVFLELLQAFKSEGRPVGPSPSNTYAPSVFSRDDRACGLTKKEFERAMSRMFSRGVIRAIETGPTSRRRKAIEVVGFNDD